MRLNAFHRVAYPVPKVHRFGAEQLDMGSRQGRQTAAQAAEFGGGG
jgi:hypothetical protein